MYNVMTIKNEKALVSSRDVAKSFGKEHNHTLRDIRNIMSDLSDNPKLDSEIFIENEYENSRGRTYTEYLMDRDGFTLLVMGYTGKEALEWKMKYIKAFNEMESALSNGSYILDDKLARAKVWISEAEKQVALTEEVESLKPKADYHDKVLTSKATMTITEIAKGFNLRSGRQLNQILHDAGIQYKVGNQWVLYADYTGLGLVDERTYTIDLEDDGVVSNTHTVWTEKGRLLIYEVLTDLGYIK